MYLIDSDHLIGYFKGVERIGEILDGLKGEWSTSVICAGEIFEGSDGKETEKLVELFERIKVWEVDVRVAMVFAKLRKELRKSGNLIDNMDLLIAATCVAYDLTLVTGNKKHFERVKRLKIFTPTT